MKALDYISKEYNPSESNVANEFAYSRKWLGIHLDGFQFVNILFKPRLLPVYKRDDNGEYVKDKDGNKIVGYMSVKIEYSWTDPDTGEVSESTNRLINGERVDTSLWAYNKLSQDEIDKIMRRGIKDVCSRTGLYIGEDKSVSARTTWDALVLGNGETLTPVGAKRGYREYDA